MLKRKSDISYKNLKIIQFHQKIKEKKNVISKQPINAEQGGPVNHVNQIIEVEKEQPGSANKSEKNAFFQKTIKLVKPNLTPIIPIEQTDKSESDENEFSPHFGRFEYNVDQNHLDEFNCLDITLFSKI